MELYNALLYHSFSLFSMPLFDVIPHFGLRFHQYVVETHVYIAVEKTQVFLRQWQA